MTRRLLAPLVVLVTLLLAPGQALAMYPAASGYRPPHPDSCSWSCVNNVTPTQYNRLQNLLNQLGTYDPSGNERLQVQEAMFRQAETVQAITNTLKSVNDTTQTIVNNLR